MSTPLRPAPRSMGTPTMSISAGRLLTGLIVVKTATAFPAQITRCDHLAQERRRRKARLLELVEEHVGDIQRRIEADEVEQGEWPHRVAGTQHHPDVDVLSGGEALLEHANGLGQVGNQQEVDDESAPILADDDALAEAFTEARGRGQRLVR